MPKTAILNKYYLLVYLLSRPTDLSRTRI